MMKPSSLLELVIPYNQHQIANFYVDVPFPKNFRDVVKNIFKRLFRVYAHIYYSHFHKIVSLGEEAHLNTCFKHFYYFIVEFNLIDKKEMEPLQELINNLTKNDKPVEKKP